jgi:hypothetical protein
MNLDLSRRTVVRGVAWSVPVVAVVAPVPVFAASRCGVTGGITVGPNQTTSYRAICASQSQQTNPATIKAVYGNGQLPQYLQLCTCDSIKGWYRWRETDTLSNFQIEVDGVHVDQFGPNAGYRPPVYLDVNAQGLGECRNFVLTYRTSAERSRTQTSNFQITWVLQRSTSGFAPGTSQAVVAAGAWTDVQTFTRNVSIIRTVGTDKNDQTDFNSCTAQGRVVAGKRD